MTAGTCNGGRRRGGAGVQVLCSEVGLKLDGGDNLTMLGTGDMKFAAVAALTRGELICEDRATAFKVVQRG